MLAVQDVGLTTVEQESLQVNFKVYAVKDQDIPCKHFLARSIQKKKSSLI